MTTESHDVVPTGFRSLDALLGGGLRPGTLTVLAGVTGSGASMLAFTAIRNAVFGHGVPTYLATNEYMLDDVMAMLMAGELGVPTRGLRNGKLDDGQAALVQANKHRFAEMPLTIDADPWSGFVHISGEMERIERLGFAVVDSVHGLALGPEAPYLSEQWVQGFGLALKRLARQKNIPVLATVKLNRPEKGRFRPLLGDLPTGGFETAADVLLMLDPCDAWDKQALTESGWDVDVIVAKQRGGATGAVNLVHQAHLGRFVEIGTDPRAGAA